MEFTPLHPGELVTSSTGPIMWDDNVLYRARVIMNQVPNRVPMFVISMSGEFVLVLACGRLGFVRRNMVYPV